MLRDTGLNASATGERGSMRSVRSGRTTESPSASERWYYMRHRLSHLATTRRVVDHTIVAVLLARVLGSLSRAFTLV